MRFKPVTLLAPLLAGLLAACGGGDPLPDTGAASTEAADAVPDQTALAVRPGQAASTADLVLQLRRGASIGPVAARHGLRVLGQFGQRPIYRVQVAAGLSADTVLAAVQQDSDVRFAERNVASQTPEGRRNSVWLIGGDARAYATQWVPPSLNLPAAHGLSTGRGVRVAVLDTGLQLLQQTLMKNRAARDDHEQLVAQVARAMQRAGRVVWRGLSLRARVGGDGGIDGEAEPSWAMAMPDVYSIRHTTVEDYVEPVAHEIKVRRADLLADLRRPAKGEAYRWLSGECWYVIRAGIAQPDEIPEEERALMTRALDENSVVVAQMEPFFKGAACAEDGGIVGDICETDYSGLMEELGLEASGILSTFALSNAAVEETIQVLSLIHI